MVAKHVNKKNVGKPRVLVINALLHSLAALAATFSAVAFYCYRGFIKGRAPGKLTGCEHDFARLLYISKNFFLIPGAIKNSFKLQSCPFLDESRV